MKSSALKLSLLFLLCACGSQKSDHQQKAVSYTANCFYTTNGYVYLNFYNSENKDIYVKRNDLLHNNDLSLKDRYCKLKQDTLFLNVITSNDISVSDTRQKDFRIMWDTIKIEPGKSHTRVFKSDLKFNAVLLNDQGRTVIFEKCP